MYVRLSAIYLIWLFSSQKVQRKACQGNQFDQWPCFPRCAYQQQQDQMKMSKSKGVAKKLREKRKQVLEAQATQTNPPVFGHHFPQVLQC